MTYEQSIERFPRKMRLRIAQPPQRHFAGAMVIEKRVVEIAQHDARTRRAHQILRMKLNVINSRMLFLLAGSTLTTSSGLNAGSFEFRGSSGKNS